MFLLKRLSPWLSLIYKILTLPSPLSSRNTTLSHDHNSLIAELNSMGCEAVLVCNSVVNLVVLFSSLSEVVGQPGRAKYASANMFLDAFDQMRTQLGLPASAIDNGAVGVVGFLSENSRLLQELTCRAVVALKEQEVLDAMKLAVVSKPAKTPVESNSYYFVKNINF
jgi:hypothetical protein